MIDKWDARFLDLAERIAKWSRDPSTQVGAVIVRPNRTIVSVGYNGLPRGVSDNDERLADRETRLAMTVHAETNALLTAERPVTGCTLYVTPFQPCSNCAAAIVQSGVSRVVSWRGYPERWAASFQTSRILFAEAGVEVALFDRP